jgi:hypothetical protein
MSEDVAMFAGGVALLVGYLIFSAKTEMGTQIKVSWPWKNEKEK